MPVQHKQLLQKHNVIYPQKGQCFTSAELRNILADCCMSGLPCSCAAAHTKQTKKQAAGKLATLCIILLGASHSGCLLWQWRLVVASSSVQHTQQSIVGIQALKVAHKCIDSITHNLHVDDYSCRTGNLSMPAPLACTWRPVSLLGRLQVVVWRPSS